jgi:hypothetical protein
MERILHGYRFDGRGNAAMATVYFGCGESAESKESQLVKAQASDPGHCHPIYEYTREGDARIYPNKAEMTGGKRPLPKETII